MGGTGFGIVTLLLLLAPWGAARAAEPPSWAPLASEQLIRLPAGYLEKAIENDFRDSSLAEALQDKAMAIEGTAASLGQLQAAVEAARGADRDGARHRFLLAKQDYVNLMGSRLSLERQQVETRLELYRRLLDRIERAGGAGDDPDMAELAERRIAALRRLEASEKSVDLKLFASASSEESRYGREYRKQTAAIEGLVRAIEAHPMYADPPIDGRQMGKAEVLAHLIAGAESDIALLDQKEMMLAYMAKLVALDARSLADEVDGRDGEGGARPELRDPTSAVGFFTEPN